MNAYPACVHLMTLGLNCVGEKKRKESGKEELSLDFYGFLFFLCFKLCWPKCSFEFFHTIL